MDKQAVVHIHNGILLSYKKNNTFESTLMWWMKLESIIQNEVSQKEKHKYRKRNTNINAYIWNLERQ